MKISVVVTSYNLEKYIGLCFLSVAGQTYSPDEIILADDSSTDNTVAIALKFIPGLIVVKQSANGGALNNTLAGLSRATGDLVAFIDGDDTWPKDKLRRMVEEFSIDSAVILVTHGHRRVDADGVPTGKFDDTHKNIARILDVQDVFERQKMLRRSIIRREGVWFGSAYSIRRSALDLILFKSLVVPQVESRYSYLDLVLAPFIVVANPAGRIAYMSDVIFDYRIHAENSAASNTVEKQLTALTRVRSTNVLTKKCLTLLNSDLDVSRRYDQILKEYDFLNYLYTKQYAKALFQYFSMALYLLKKRSFLKELGRFVLVVFLGPSKFLKMK